MKKLNKEKLNQALSDRMQNDLKRSRTAGEELLVYQDGEMISHLTGGLKDVDTGEVLAPNAMYRLASMTKPITAAAALIAVDKGYFKLEDEVREYLPGFSDMDVAVLKDGRLVIDHKAHSQLKIYQMMCHSSGVLAATEVGAATEDMADKETYTSLVSALDFAYRQPLAFDPGEYAAYSGRISFDAIAHIIELKSGKKFSEFLQENLFAPMGIHDLTFHPTAEQWERMVTVHDRTGSKGLVSVKLAKDRIYENFPLTYEGAGCCLAGAAEDYAKFARMLCNFGEYNGKTILKPELVEEMRKPRIPEGVYMSVPNDSWTDGDNWGLGVRVKARTSRLPKGAFGWSGAYGTHFWVDPENRITAVLMRNMRWYDTHGCGQMGVRFESDVMSCLE